MKHTTINITRSEDNTVICITLIKDIKININKYNQKICKNLYFADHFSTYYFFIKIKKNQPGIHRMQEKKENLLSLKIILNCYQLILLFVYKEFYFQYKASFFTIV